MNLKFTKFSPEKLLLFVCIAAIIYGLLALCAGYVSEIPAEVSLPNIYLKIFKINKGLSMSLGLFFIISGFFAIRKKIWARTMLLSTSLFRIFLIVFSVIFSAIIYFNSDYQEFLIKEFGEIDNNILIFTLLFFLIIELIIPVFVSIILLRNKIKNLFLINKPNEDV